MKRQATEDFFDTHPVFSLEEALQVLDPPGGRPGMLERLKYHLGTGRLQSVTRGVYAVVPAGIRPDQFSPDPYLAAAAVRPECVFAYHSALDLLGSSHSVLNLVTVFNTSPRQPLTIGGVEIRFLAVPHAVLVHGDGRAGTTEVERRGRWLRVTGRERTLVEGFRSPGYAGGMEELVLSAGGFPVLDLELLVEVLEIYDTRRLWAAVGWFLESFRRSFSVPEAFLIMVQAQRPGSPLYLVRDQRGGKLLERWNLIVPEELLGLGEDDETGT